MPRTQFQVQQQDNPRGSDLYISISQASAVRQKIPGHLKIVTTFTQAVRTAFSTRNTASNTISDVCPGNSGSKYSSRHNDNWYIQHSMTKYNIIVYSSLQKLAVLLLLYSKSKIIMKRT